MVVRGGGPLEFAREQCRRTLKSLKDLRHNTRDREVRGTVFTA